jgi:hypothetical protein
MPQVSRGRLQRLDADIRPAASALRSLLEPLGADGEAGIVHVPDRQ